MYDCTEAMMTHDLNISSNYNLIMLLYYIVSQTREDIKLMLKLVRTL